MLGPATILNDIAIEEESTLYRFIVIATGTAPLNYTWYINGTLFSTGLVLTVPMINFIQGPTQVRVEVINHDSNTGDTFTDTRTLQFVIGKSMLSIDVQCSTSCY